MSDNWIDVDTRLPKDGDRIIGRTAMGAMWKEAFDSQEPIGNMVEWQFDEECGLENRVANLEAEIVRLRKDADDNLQRALVAEKESDRLWNTISSVCEGWTLPDDARKHLESALWPKPIVAPDTSTQEVG